MSWWAFHCFLVNGCNDTLSTQISTFVFLLYIDENESMGVFQFQRKLCKIKRNLSLERKTKRRKNSLPRKESLQRLRNLQLCHLLAETSTHAQL
jgi:hypothetical protein